MAKLSHHLRLVLLLGLVATCSTPAFAQVTRPTRSLYLGSILNVTSAGSNQEATSAARQVGRHEPILLDLTLYPDGFAYGRLSLPGRGLVVAGSGTLQQGTDLRMVFNEPRGSNAAWGPKLAHDLATSDRSAEGTRGAEARPADTKTTVIASFSGRRESGFSSAGRTISGSLSITAYPGTVLTTELQRFAEFSTWEFSQGRIHAAVTAPHVVVGGEALNELLESSQRGRLERFVNEGQDYASDGILGWAWELEEYVTIEGVAGSYLSLLNSIYTYTGGAHPNTFFNSYLYELRPSGVTEVTLDQLFRSDSNWLSRLTPLILSDLERQEASWVTQGQVTELTTVDLAAFTLGPSGLTFHFSPYSMGPYVQGSFAVTIEFGQLLGLAPAGGALELFARGAAFN